MHSEGFSKKKLFNRKRIGVPKIEKKILVVVGEGRFAHKLF